MTVIPEREMLIHVAIDCGSEEIVKFIVKEGMADVDARTIPEEVMVIVWGEGGACG